MNEDRGTKGKQRQQKKKKGHEYDNVFFWRFCDGFISNSDLAIDDCGPQLSAMATWPG